MVKVFLKSGNQSKEMTFTICNCFQQMRDWKVENLAKVLGAVLLWRVNSIPKVPNLSNVYITSIEIVFLTVCNAEVPLFHNG